MRAVILSTIAVPLLSACQVSVVNRNPNAPTPTPSADVEYVTPPGAPSTLPFSDVVRVGNILYLSGKLGTDPRTNQLVPGGIAAETRQAMENIRSTLEANGSSMDRVVKCTVMLTDIKEWGAMNQVYVTFFPTHKPARSAMGTGGLALGGRVEIECLALAGP